MTDYRDDLDEALRAFDQGRPTSAVEDVDRSLVKYDEQRARPMSFGQEEADAPSQSPEEVAAWLNKQLGSAQPQARRGPLDRFVPTQQGLSSAGKMIQNVRPAAPRPEAPQQAPQQAMQKPASTPTQQPQQRESSFDRLYRLAQMERNRRSRLAGRMGIATAIMGGDVPDDNDEWINQPVRDLEGRLRLEGDSERLSQGRMRTEFDRRRLERDETEFASEQRLAAELGNPQSSLSMRRQDAMIAALGSDMTPELEEMVRQTPGSELPSAGESLENMRDALARIAQINARGQYTGRGRGRGGGGGGGGLNLPAPGSPEEADLIARLARINGMSEEDYSVIWGAMDISSKKATMRNTAIQGGARLGRMQGAEERDERADTAAVERMARELGRLPEVGRAARSALSVLRNASPESLRAALMGQGLPPGIGGAEYQQIQRAIQNVRSLRLNQLAGSAVSPTEEERLTRSLGMTSTSDPAVMMTAIRGIVSAMDAAEDRIRAGNLAAAAQFDENLRARRAERSGRTASQIRQQIERIRQRRGGQ